MRRSLGQMLECADDIARRHVMPGEFGAARAAAREGARDCQVALGALGHIELID